MPKIGAPRPSGGAAAPSPGKPWTAPQATREPLPVAKRTPPDAGRLNAYEHAPEDHYTFSDTRVCVCVCPECWPDDATPCPWTVG